MVNPKIINNDPGDENDYDAKRLKEIKHKLVVNAIANPLRVLSREDLEFYCYHLQEIVWSGED